MCYDSFKNKTFFWQFDYTFPFENVLLGLKITYLQSQEVMIGAKQSVHDFN